MDVQGRYSSNLTQPEAARFAKASGRLAKTDKIDAEILAHYAEVMRPEVKPLPDEKIREITELVARRRQLIDMLAEEKNRLHQASFKV